MSGTPILVVEDNPITRKMLRVTLEAEHYTVLEAADGGAALEILDREHPALVLQDFVLPDMNGAELLTRIRKLRGADDLPIVLLTGLTSRATEIEAQGGFTLVLPKPVEPSRLVDTVGRLLAGRPAPRRTAPVPRRVLVVDDEVTNRRLVEVQLHLAGYQPTVVATVEETLQAARTARPDVILADVLMPGLDGFQLCLAARRDSDLAAIPIVLVSSAFVHEDDRALALQVGASDLVLRTPDLGAAIEAIERACRPGAPPPVASGAALDQEYLAALRRQVDRQMVRNQELAKRAGIQAAALSMVGALAQALANPREVTAVLGDVLVHCLDAAGLSTGILYLRSSGGDLRVHSLAGLRDTLRAAADTGFGQPQVLEPQAGGTPLAFNRETADAAQRAFLDALQQRSVLVVPFVVLGRHYGTLVLASDLHDLADMAWWSFARALAAQFGQAVALGRSLGELAESDALLRGAVEASPNGMIMSDAAGRIVMVNRQAEQMFGYAEGQLAGRQIENLVPARHRAAHLGHRSEFATERRQRAMGAGRELFGLHKNGHEFPVEIGLAPVQRGEATFVIASIVDITERRRAEEQLRWLSLAIEQGPTSVVMTDLAGNIEYVNAKFTEVTGYALAEVRGKNPRLLQSGETAAAVYADLWGAITTGRSWFGEVLNRKKDGTTYWDAMWVYPIRDGSGTITRFLALKEDVTERKRAERTVVENASRLQALMDNASDGIAVLSGDGRILEINRRMAEILGRPATEVVSRDIREFTPADSPGATYQDFLDAFRRGRGRVQGVEVLRPDQTAVIVDFSLSTVNIDGVPLALSIGRDVTHQRSLERQLLQAQKMEAVGRLAGGVAHDFNNVLTAVFGYTDMMLEDQPAESPLRQDIGEIRKAAERAASLTRQLLAFSRQQVMQPVVLNLNDGVENLEKMLRRLIGEDVALRTVLAEDLGNVRADPGQIEQVIMNLAINARDAMPTGGQLTLETANADLSEQYADLHQPVVAGRYVMLAVSDTGVGMTAQIKSRIFEPFFTTKEKGKGTGLGLATVYGIVKQSGGYVWVYSEPAHGATFKIYLPRVDAPVDSAKPMPEIGGKLAGTETILLAEDDDLLRPLAKGLLEKLGYAVLDAPNAADAFDLAGRHAGPIHLLVADVVMPGGSGRDLAQRIAPVRPDTKVLYVSGYTDDAIVRHGMLEPGLSFLQKPFTPAALAKKVREVLDTP